MPQPEHTYALGAVCRITGLTPHVVRVWERRYGAVVPLRTPKGTRRYRVADVARLQLLRAAVESGHRIGAVAQLDDAALQAIASGRARSLAFPEPVDRAIAAIEVLDAPAAERVISDQLLALGSVRFAREFALPLLQGVGARWFDGRLCVAAEHLASALLRSLLGAALRPPPASSGAPAILFATLPGERHELGLLVSALVAMGAGASPIYLGAELPPAELARAVGLANARAVALAVTHPGRNAEREVATARAAIGADTELWLGGPAASALALPARVTVLETLDDLERNVKRLREAKAIRALRSPRAARSTARARKRVRAKR